MDEMRETRSGRRSTSSSASSDSLASFRGDGLSTVIGKLLDELQEIDLLSSDEDEDGTDGDSIFDAGSDNSFVFDDAAAGLHETLPG
jgi:hypothetical protein